MSSLTAYQKTANCVSALLLAVGFGASIGGLVMAGQIDKSSPIIYAPAATCLLTTLGIAYTVRQSIMLGNDSNSP